MTHSTAGAGRRHRTAAVAIASGAAATLAVGAFGLPAQAADSDEVGDLSITADGYYGTVRVDFGGSVPFVGDVAELEGNATIGLVQSEVDSAGLEGHGPETYSRAVGSLVGASALGVDLPVQLYAAEQTALPEEPDTETVGVHDLGVPGIGNLRGISAEVKANWNDDILAHGSAGGELTTLYSGVGQVDLVDLGDLDLLDGVLGSLVPSSLAGDGPLFSVGAGQLLQETGVFGKENGSQGAYAEVSGRFGDMNILGGAANGGITVGLAASSDTENPNAWGRLQATGEPGGASFEYELPALELYVGDEESGIRLEPGFDQTFEVLPGVKVNINFADYRNDETVLAEDGTYAAASGGGLSARVTVGVPVPLVGEVELGQAEVGILSFPEVSVEVPQGGLFADADDDDDDDGFGPMS